MEICGKFKSYVGNGQCVERVEEEGKNGGKARSAERTVRSKFAAFLQ